MLLVNFFQYDISFDFKRVYFHGTILIYNLLDSQVLNDLFSIYHPSPRLDDNISINGRVQFLLSLSHSKKCPASADKDQIIFLFISFTVPSRWQSIFSKWDNSASFSNLFFSNIIYYTKNCTLERDSSLNHRRIGCARWPLDHHQGKFICSYWVSEITNIIF